MTSPRYIDRKTHQEMTEQVYGKFYIDLLYGTSWFSHLLSFILLPLFAHINFLSRLYGSIQKSSFTKEKILPFIKNFHVDTSEFLDPVDSFHSFNDFFIRKLKSECRPIVSDADIAILPADGRYLVYENIEKTDGFFVKGKKFSLQKLLRDPSLTEQYAQGAMAIARLAPVDYHRFHFPVDCLPEQPQPIAGPLFSVNPAALKKHAEILAENKRVITPLKTKNFGTVIFIEVGATYVGTIHQTFQPFQPQSKGNEKGYFSFGGSSLILLFEPGRIHFDQDLVEASNRCIEVLGQMGQSLGRALVSKEI
jgi:phosphatidylserine decarboxylase